MDSFEEVHAVEELWAAAPDRQRQLYVSERVTTQYPVQDCGESLLPIEPATDRLMIVGGSHRLRSGAKERLLKAEALLQEVRPEIGFAIYQTLRPIAMQRVMFKSRWKVVRDPLGPTASKEEIWAEVTKWVADPSLLPPHSTGGKIGCSCGKQ